jgi:hypothetical protein
MIATTVGAAALGSVCGWWCAPLAGARAQLRSWATAGGALAAVWLQTVALAGRAAGIALPIGFAVGLAAHAGFRAVLVARLAPQRR